MSRKKQYQTSDTRAKKLLSSKGLYFVVLLLSILALYYKGAIINEAKLLKYMKVSASITLLFSLFIWRFLKFKDYYLRKFKDRLYVVYFIVAFGMSSWLLSEIIGVPLDYYLIHESRVEPTKTIDCEIVSYTRKKKDKVTYRFKGELYNHYMVIPDERVTDVSQKYMVRLRVKPTLFEAYYVESIKLVKL
ncbi:hypothetical protein [Pontibacter anaerobius]|uniref:DUF5673 domain-containing protein n=1 Tax=Pontibacter anaerobius TaxID=2993940 RepID=A0ABT3RCD1_9BACT|nr:hypothetical protein [Pontibacter anaerobius]MCX2739502.1 hypothetical protein [Pontibacter anaerobius]